MGGRGRRSDTSGGGQARRPAQIGLSIGLLSGSETKRLAVKNATTMRYFARPSPQFAANRSILSSERLAARSLRGEQSVEFVFPDATQPRQFDLVGGADDDRVRQRHAGVAELLREFAGGCVANQQRIAD